MNNLTKRVDALEQVPGNESRPFLFVDYASDGGLVYRGVFYSSVDTMLKALGCERGGAHVLGGQAGKTVAELLEEAAERAKNPPPEVTLDELGEYGRKLVTEKGITPAVAALLETLNQSTREHRE